VTGIVSPVGKRVTTGVSAHVGMGLKPKLRFETCALDHAGETSRCERRAPF
jgi:hypothetical protein